MSQYADGQEGERPDNPSIRRDRPRRGARKIGLQAERLMKQVDGGADSERRHNGNTKTRPPRQRQGAEDNRNVIQVSVLARQSPACFDPEGDEKDRARIEANQGKLAPSHVDQRLEELGDSQLHRSARAKECLCMNIGSIGFGKQAPRLHRRRPTGGHLHLQFGSIRPGDYTSLT